MQHHIHKLPATMASLHKSKYLLQKCKTPFGLSQKNKWHMCTTTSRLITVMSQRYVVIRSSEKICTNGIGFTNLHFSRAVHSGIDFELHEMELQCNEDRWHEHPEAVMFKTKFIDTHYNLPLTTQRNARTILGIHGTPGSHKDLLPLVEPFVDKGYRVVIVNLPGNEYATMESKKEAYFFTHSLNERTEYLIYFLSNLDLRNIDLAVGHCTGTGPLTMLLATSDVIKSSLYICPVPGNQPVPGLGNLSNLKRVLRAYDRPIFRPIAWLFMIRMCKNANLSPLNMQPKHLQYITQTFAYYNYHSFQDLAMQVVMKRYPLTYIYTSDDPIVDKELSAQYAATLGITAESTLLLDKESKHDSLARRYRQRGILLESANHCPQEEEVYQKVIIKEIEMLLNQVKNR